MGPPGNRGSWGPCVLAHTQKSLHSRSSKIPELKSLFNPMESLYFKLHLEDDFSMEMNGQSASGAD
ncbi:unnamed protein product [Staurois parvus]|uniref:Uncharacterized protein n=1 Tax=Staurois parvus TaxID=386267 RepID=A0ABN9FNL8_9NEOB|nr:unnamed protein product [Staurois parvus]